MSEIGTLRRSASLTAFRAVARAYTKLPKFARFVAVGLLNTAFGYGVFAGLWLATGDHRLAIVGAYVLGITFNFFSTGRLVFGRQNLVALVPFVLGYGALFLVNIGILAALLTAG